jgi:hypothetical protein
MKELLKLTENFEVSRPVFRLTLYASTNASRVDANMRDPVYKYTPSPEEGNPLSELVCSNYSETFRNGAFTINKWQIAKESMTDVRKAMRVFIEKNLDMKSPRQSKIYRWYYRNLPDNDDFNDTLVMVYKYLRSFCDTDLKSSNIEHTKNAMALLDAIMEKYNER